MFDIRGRRYVGIDNATEVEPAVRQWGRDLAEGVGNVCRRRRSSLEWRHRWGAALSICRRLRHRMPNMSRFRHDVNGPSSTFDVEDTSEWTTAGNAMGNLRSRTLGNLGGLRQRSSLSAQGPMSKTALLRPLGRLLLLLGHQEVSGALRGPRGRVRRVR